MSDNDDDFMCDDDEDYGLVCIIILTQLLSPTMLQHFFDWNIYVYICIGILRGQQLRAGRGSREPILQQQSAKRGRAESCTRQFSEGAWFGEWGERRMGIQSAQTNDKNQL